VQTGAGTTEVELKPGQFIFGRKTASEELKMKPSSVRNRMVKLQNIENLDIQPDTHYSIITICNWGKYQINENINGQASGQAQDNHMTGTGQPQDTNKKGKKVKKVKNKYLEYVFLTEKEHQRLLDEFGEKQINEMIKILDDYIGAMPKKRNKYTDHNRVLQSWVLKRYQEENGGKDDDWKRRFLGNDK